MPGLPMNRMRVRGWPPQAVCALAAATVLSSGCATTMNGSTQRVSVASDPPGARIFLGGEALGMTPTVVTLDRRDPDPGLRLEKDCYRTTVLRVPRRTSRWVAGNLLFAGAPVNEYTWGQWLTAMAVYTTVGALADRRRGGAFKFPNLVRATLERLPAAPEAALRGGDLEPRAACAPGRAANSSERRIAPLKSNDNGASSATGVVRRPVARGPRGNVRVADLHRAGGESRRIVAQALDAVVDHRQTR